jgi:translation initiation factor RLI1
MIAYWLCITQHPPKHLPAATPYCSPPCSYKPQKISPKFEGTVRQLLHKKIRESYLHPQFNADVMKPMNIEALMDQEVQNLSGES